MNIESKIIRIFVSFFAILAAILMVVAGFLFVQKNCGIDYQGQSAFLAAANQIKNTPLPSPADAKPSIKMLFFGDMMLDRNVGAVIKQNGLPYLFEKISNSENSIFQNQDIIACNLEGAVTISGQHYPPYNGFDFAFAPGVISQLKNYGFNLFNLANNHFADQGQTGMDETRQNLDNLGFNYVGCPDGQISECSTKILYINGWQIGLAGFSSVYSVLDQEQLKGVINELAAKTDFVIVNMHWGVEYQHQFSQSQQETAHNLIDAGADLMIGHHPHVVQGMEIYQGKPIFYSLGNFIFDQYFSADTQEGLALAITFDEQKLTIDFRPIKSSRSQPSLLTEAEKNKFLERFSGWSLFDSAIAGEVNQGQFVLLR